MATPAKPRPSGLPTPGRSSGIPTPGRPRSTSRAGPVPPLRVDAESERAFDALRKSNANHQRDSDISVASSTSSNYPNLSPQAARHPPSGRRSVAGGPRPGSVASTSSALSSGPPRTPISRPKTPVTKPRLSAHPRPESRQSEVRNGVGPKSFDIGDPVRIESLGFDGILRYVGEIEGKSGTFAGVELGGGLVGKGKNDGSVGSIQYFTCPPKCGVFVSISKLSRAPQRPVSVVSSVHSGRITPAPSGRETPIYTTPSAKPRFSRQMAPSVTPQFTAGSIASKYAGITAERLRNATNTFTNTSHKLTSPTQSSPSRTSPIRFSRSSPTRTPKATAKLSVSRSSDALASPARIELTTPKPMVRSQTLASFSSPPIGLLSSSIPADGILSPESRRAQLESEFTEEFEGFRAQIANLETERSRLLEGERSVKDELTAANKSLRDTLERVASLEPLETRLRETEELLSARTHEFSALEQQFNGIQAALIETQREATLSQAQMTEQLRLKSQALEDLESTTANSKREFESEKTSLLSQVDELRSAGQETIALYEDRLSVAEARRYELEDAVNVLQDKMSALSRPLSPATMAKHASEAAQIDNESLREQAAHLQRRIASLEELLEDTRSTSRTEEEALRTKLEKQRESELLARKEMETWKSRVEESRRGEGAYRSRIEELEAALRENAVALEDARSEIESLRSELEIHESRRQPDEEYSKEMEEKLIEKGYEIEKLQQSLGHAEKTRKQLEDRLTNGLGEPPYLEELHASKAALENEKQELLDDVDVLSEKVQLQLQLLEELQGIVNDQQEEIKSLKKAADVASLNSSSSSNVEKDSRPSRHDLAEKREEIAGLKHIVQQLSQENAALQSQLKMVEAERDLLLSESDRLRKDLQVMESDRSSLEDAKVPNNRLVSVPDVESVELKRKLTESESRHARVVYDLKKEISELETLVESKIYREDELERELEKYKEKAARAAKKLSKLSNDSTTKELNRSSVASVNIQADLCEICEQPGHDIFTCPILKEEKVDGMVAAQEATQLWCEDCDTFGHLPIDCPHSTDVF